MNYSETIDYLFSSLRSFQDVGTDAYKPGLERITELCRRLGNPQRNYYVIHIAGTNGKGSTAHMIASILQQAGYQTGLYTSPHLTDFRERIRINGEMISKQKVVNFVDKHRQDIEELGLSFFEMATGMAFDYFAQSDVEVAVIETGLGGRLDATNIVQPILSVITNIGLEHTEYLGDTLPKIAREKGGIIKKCTPVILGEKNPEYSLVLEEIASDMKTRVIYAEDNFVCMNQYTEDGMQVFDMQRKCDEQQYVFRTALLGKYQKQNITLVCAITNYLHNFTPLSITRRAFIEGIRTVTDNGFFRGRWQTIADHPRIICDTGHNAHGMRQVAEQLESCAAEGRLFCVMGFCNDKNIPEMLSMLPHNAKYIFTAASVHRAEPVESLAGMAEVEGLDFSVAQTVGEALAEARKLAGEDDMIFIGGSTYVVAEAME